MIEITEIRIPIEQAADTAQEKELLQKRAARLLHIRPEDIREITILRRSLDARKKPRLYYVYRLALTCAGSERKLLRRQRDSSIRRYERTAYRPPQLSADTLSAGRTFVPPVVIGAGPAGLFCAYLLAQAGAQPVLLERGRSARQRKADVERFWKDGKPDPSSNVQFGEGGAGTFSDGKLTTQIGDRQGRLSYILESFVRFGADASILYEARPHIGTDVLIGVVTAMREEIERLGGRVLFEHQVTELLLRDGRLHGLTVNHGETLPCMQAALCIGHSARDTFRMLHAAGVDMQAKEFAAGYRIEHPQEMIDRAMYGRTDVGVPSPYKLAASLPDGRRVYSFCMCPGGYVVNASSSNEELAINGMSYAGRASGNANSAIVVSVDERDFGGTDPLAGVIWQENIERRAFARADGRIPQQLLGDFQADKSSKTYGSFVSLTKGARQLSSVRGILPSALEAAFASGMELFGQRIEGFAAEDVVISAVESRTSSPVRIPRDAQFHANIRGLYPCGEGAGYAGGIMSAAADGMRVAEQMIRERERVLR